MQLPFTLDEFLAVFAAYNGALWPVSVALWLITAGVFALIVRDDARAPRALGWLLVVHWTWSGLVYHLLFFRVINPAAWLFGLLFVVQAGLWLRWTLRAPQTTAFSTRNGLWSKLGLALMAYALVYPAIGLAAGLRYPQLPTFGVPCPTTLFTVGALLLGRSSMPWGLALIPIAWTVVGGSAAMLFGVYADIALPLAGLLAVASLVTRRQRGFAS